MEKSILITGGAGFIGSHITTWLFEAGYTVLVLDKKSNYISIGKSNYLNNYFDKLDQDNKNRFRNQVIMIEFDLQNKMDIETNLSILKQYSIPKLIIHLASEVGVSNILEKDTPTFNSLQMTLNVAEFAQNYGIPVLFASTSEIFGNNLEINDQSPSSINTGGQSSKRGGYAAQKLASEYIFLELDKSIGLRFFNITGIGQEYSSGMFLPKLFHSIKSGIPFSVNNSAKRVFTNIEDIYTRIPILTVIYYMVNNPYSNNWNHEIFNIGLSKQYNLNNYDLDAFSLTNTIDIITDTLKPYYPRHVEKFKEQLINIDQFYTEEINERFLQSNEKFKLFLDEQNLCSLDNGRLWNNIDYANYLKMMTLRYFEITN